MMKADMNDEKLSLFNKGILTAAIVSILGVGCSSDNSDPVASTVTGSVAKGIVQKGLVTAYALNKTGDPGAAVGTATTGDDGSYMLTMTDSYDGVSPLLLELTPADKTTMICDVRTGCGDTAFGSTISLAADSGFKLSAVVPSAGTGKKVSAAITAFTNMAASSILASDDVTESSVLAVNSQVSQIAGVNILSDLPVNIADTTALSAGTPKSQRYAIMLAALASQAFVDTGEDGVSVQDVIDNLNTINTDFSADGIIGNDSGGLSPTKLYAAATAEVEALGDNIDAETATDAKQFVTAMSGQIKDGALTPIKTTGENPTEIAQAKDFMTEVRTWASALQDLENPASAFLDEASTISDTLDANSSAVLEVYALAIEAAAAAIDGTEDALDSIDVMNNGVLLGTISITDNSTATTRGYSISGSDLAGVAVEAILTLNAEPTDDTIAAGDVVLGVSGSASNNKVTISLSEASFTVTLAKDFNTGANGGQSSEPSFGGIALAGKLSVKSATGEEITAEAELKFVALNSSFGGSLDNDMNITLEKIALNNLSVTNNTGETAGLSVSLQVNDASSFDTLSYLNAEPVIYKNLNGDPADYDFSAAKESFGIESLNQFNYYVYYNNYGMAAQKTCADGYDSSDNWVSYSCNEGDIANINTQVSSQFNQPYVRSVEVEDFYSYQQQYASSQVRLELDDMETAESFLDATLNITGNINLAERDEATLTITANKTDIKAGNMTATLGYAGKSLQMSALTTNGNEDGTDASLSFSNVDGVAMTVSNSDDWVSGNVTVGNEEVGTISSEDGLMIIRYNDGTFESL